MIAAIATGAIFGAIYRFVPELTRSANSQTAVIVDVIAAIVAGVVLVCYMKFVRWIQKRENRNS